MQDKTVLAAHVFQDFDEDFLVGETADIRLAEWDFQIFGDLLCQDAVGVACEEFHVLSAVRWGACGLYRGRFRAYQWRVQNFNICLQGLNRRRGWTSTCEGCSW